MASKTNSWETRSFQGQSGYTSSAQVEALQRELVAQGAKITVDGTYGPATAAAVKQYGTPGSSSGGSGSPSANKPATGTTGGSSGTSSGGGSESVSSWEADPYKGWKGKVEERNGEKYAVNDDGTYGLLRLGDSSIDYTGAKKIYGNGMYADFGSGKEEYAYKGQYRGLAPGTIIMGDGGSWLDGKTGKYGPQTIKADGPGGARYTGSVQENFDALNDKKETAAATPATPATPAAPLDPGKGPLWGEEEYEDFLKNMQKYANTNGANWGYM